MFATRTVCKTCNIVHEVGSSQAEKRAANRALVARGLAVDSYPAADPTEDAWYQPRVNLTALLRQEII